MKIEITRPLAYQVSHTKSGGLLTLPLPESDELLSGCLQIFAGDPASRDLANEIINLHPTANRLTPFRIRPSIYDTEADRLTTFDSDKVFGADFLLAVLRSFPEDCICLKWDEKSKPLDHGQPKKRR